MSCAFCDESISEDTLYTIGIKNDTIYYFTRKEGDLDLAYLDAHASAIPRRLEDFDGYKYHYEVFRDSLTKDSIDYHDMALDLGSYFYDQYVSKLKRKLLMDILTVGTGMMNIPW